MNDDGDVVAIRVRRLEGRSYLENRARATSTCGASRSSTCACRCSSTCAATRSRSRSTTRTPTTTGSSTGPFVLVPLQALASKFLMTMKEFPPSQTPGSFNLEKIQKQLEAATGSK